jgi:hypothetical protein
MFALRESSDKERRARPLGAASVAAGVGFGVTLALLRFYHPLLLLRHPDRAVIQCGTVALGFSLTSPLAASVRESDL